LAENNLRAYLFALWFYLMLQLAYLLKPNSFTTKWYTSLDELSNI
jgi:hypothetical protein